MYHGREGDVVHAAEGETVARDRRSFGGKEREERREGRRFRGFRSY